MTPAELAKNKTRKILEATEIPAAEMAVRIAEAYLGLKRPPGASAEEVLALMGADARGPLAAAKAAMDYIVECVNQASTVQ